MTRILLAMPGMADTPVKNLDGKTPLSIAAIPTIRNWAKSGSVKGVTGYSDSRKDLAAFDTMGVVGGSFSLSAAIRQKINVNKSSAVACIRFVTAWDNKVVDPNCHLTVEEVHALIEGLNGLFSPAEIRFHYFHREVCVVEMCNDLNPNETRLPSPETLAAEQAPEWRHLEKNKSAGRLVEVLKVCRNFLTNSDINKIKIDLEENPANSIVLWDINSSSDDPFTFTPDSDALLLTDSDLLGKLADLYNIESSVIKPDLAALESLEPFSSRAVEAAKNRDVVIWITAAEKASYASDYKLKIRCLEAFDRFVCKPLSATGSDIVVYPVYTVSSDLRRIENHPVPVIFADAVSKDNKSPDEPAPFNEECFDRSSQLDVFRSALKSAAS